jgi:sporulation integral membrane protein YtvI
MSCALRSEVTVPTKKVIIFVVVIIGIWVFWRWAMPVILPFLLGFLIAMLVERPVKWLMKRARLPRWAASLSMSIIIVGTLSGFMYLLISRIVYETGRLLRHLPDLMTRLPVMSNDLNIRLEAIVTAAPVELQEFLRSSVEKMIREGVNLPSELYTWLGNFITGVVSALPAIALFTIALMLSSYMISSDYPGVTRFLLNQIPKNWRGRVLQIIKDFIPTIGKWLKAQGILIAMNAGLAFIGFMFLRVEYTMIMVGVIAIVDALPIVGSGFVLIPWAIFCFATGETGMGVGLVILYLVLTLVRGVSEPRIVGAQIGLPPLVSLLAIYAGFKLMGVLGMILFPFIAIFIVQLHRWGYIKLWKA